MVQNVCQLVAIQFQKISEFPIQQITISIPKLKLHKCKIMIVQTWLNGLLAIISKIQAVFIFGAH